MRVNTIFRCTQPLQCLLCRVYKCSLWNVAPGSCSRIKVRWKLRFLPGGVLHGPGCVQQGRCPRYHGQLWSAQLPASQGILPAVWDGSAEPEWLQKGSPEAPGARTRGDCYFLLYAHLYKLTWIVLMLPYDALNLPVFSCVALPGLFLAVLSVNIWGVKCSVEAVAES